MDNKDLQQIREEFAGVIEDNVNPQFEELKEDVSGLKEDVSGLKENVVTVKNQMVTKSYLDDKLADLSGDLMSKLKKEDAKLDRLVEIMKRKKVLDKNDTKELDEFQIFPKFSS